MQYCTKPITTTHNTFNGLTMRHLYACLIYNNRDMGVYEGGGEAY